MRTRQAVIGPSTEQLSGIGDPVSPNGLLLQDGDGSAFDAGVEDDQFDRFGPVVRTVVPFVNDFDHRVACFDVEDFAFARGDR